MGRCQYELLKDLEPALNELRKLEELKEKRPGIFYFKSQGFMHFHEKDGVIWADIRDGKGWGKEVVLPKKVTQAFCRSFVGTVLERLSKTRGA